jgi:uncharacterized SAM-binding protein YcdF (DUF218 family)
MSVSSHWRRWLLLLLVVGSLTGLYLRRGAVLAWVAHWLEVGGPPERAEVILLLNGEAETRAFAAAALWKAGWAPRILVSTVAHDPQHEQTGVPPEHELNLRVLWACGVPRGAVSLLDGQAASTYDEALAAADYLAHAAPQRLLVVTSGYHTRRARWIFQRVLAGKAARVAVVAAAEDAWPAEAWWRTAQGFAVISGEYLKLGFYILRYSYLVYQVAVVALLWVAWRFYRRNRLAGKDLGLMV